MVFMVWKPCLSANVAEFLFADAFDPITSNVLVNELFTIWAGCVITHLKLHKCLIGDSVPVFGLEALTWLVILLTTPATYEISTMVTLNQLKELFDLETLITAVTSFTFAHFD
jgi:hypothetical protein